MTIEEKIRALAYFTDLKDRLFTVYGFTFGNIVEIGGGAGENTIQFLLDESRITIVVDPFERIEGVDPSYFDPYPYDEFLKTVEPLRKNLQVIRKPSQYASVKQELLQFTPIGFVFVDGLQTKDAVLSDLILAQHLDAEVICVDDYDRLTESSQVPLAVMEFMKTTLYKFINIGKREAYFIKCA